MRFLPTILATILLPATASAGLLQGIGSHHAALHAKLKRANLVERDVVTVTEFEYVVVTVTAFVDESTTIVGTPVATSVIKPSPASPTPAAPSAEVPTPSPAAAAPPPPPPPPAPPSPPSPPPPPPPAPPAPVEAPAQTTPNALFNSGSGAGGSAAAPANARSGELTYYTLGLGACGFDDGGRDETENIVALSHLLLGPQSNGNPFCGRSITIQYGSRTVTAVCRDKCMGCAANDVDASTKVFKDLTGGTDLGRVQVTWWFND